MAKKPRETNEWEFQGQVLSWLNDDIHGRPESGLDRATQEAPTPESKRSDLVVWLDRGSKQALLSIEIKTPTTPITDPALLLDAWRKARRWNAPYFASWNMQAAELYATAEGALPPDPSQCLYQWKTDPNIRSVEDWLDANKAQDLRARARDILTRAQHASTKARVAGVPLDASVFVDRLAARQSHLREILLNDLRQHLSLQERAKLREIAAAQGFLGFVSDIDVAVAGQMAYRFVGQVLFYFALRRRQTSLPALEVAKGPNFLAQLRVYWDAVRRFDYEALFAPHELETLIALSAEAQAELMILIRELSAYDWSAVRDDVIGAVFEQLIPRQEQVILGQFYTPSAVADLLVAFCLRPGTKTVLDPGCGSGTFLLRAYDYLHGNAGLAHSDCLTRLWGFDISPFAVELSVINLFRQDLSSFDNYPRIVSGSFFSRKPGEYVDFPPPRVTGPGKVRTEVPQFDAIVGNPPYLRSQNQDDLNPSYKTQLQALAVAQRFGSFGKLDLFAYFLLQAHIFSHPGTRIGFVTPSSWLSAEYGAHLQSFLLKHYRAVCLIDSGVEPFFSLAAVNTVLIVLERRANDAGPTADERIAFVQLHRPLSEVFPDGAKHWSLLADFVARVEAPLNDQDTADWSLRLLNAKDEFVALSAEATRHRHWSRLLRSGLVFEKLRSEWGDRVCTLSDVATISLGYKSLQNSFFYLNASARSQYKIEPEYIRPMWRFADLDRDVYLQASSGASTHLFYCKASESDLKGTHALAYIRRMAGVPCETKKQAQSARVLTIREALKNQSGGTWYGPKAAYNPSHIWLPKAFDSTFAPCLFETQVVVDQRCNRIEPRSGISWRELAAVLTSSVFALALEVEGKNALGGGALEWATGQLRLAKVLDLRALTKQQRKSLLLLAEEVWKHEQPVDFSESAAPGACLQSLDRLVLELMGSTVATDAVYAELHDLVVRRKTKARKRQTRHKQDLSANVEAIVSRISSLAGDALLGRRFPESLIEAGVPTARVTVDSRAALTLSCEQMLTQATVAVSKGETTLFEMTTSVARAEVIVRSLLSGRRDFAYPDDESHAAKVLSGFRPWLDALTTAVNAGVSESAMGGRYEDEIRARCLRRLGISESAGAASVWGEFDLAMVEESP